MRASTYSRILAVETSRNSVRFTQNNSNKIAQSNSNKIAQSDLCYSSLFPYYAWHVRAVPLYIWSRMRWKHVRKRFLRRFAKSLNVSGQRRVGRRGLKHAFWNGPKKGPDVPGRNTNLVNTKHSSVAESIISCWDRADCDFCIARWRSFWNNGQQIRIVGITNPEWVYDGNCRG